ncbi:MAG: M61 family peptidase, partial [Bacteroidia bacterium]|nr:M61 family peptidase [Bacteroidia bacterium]
MKPQITYNIRPGASSSRLIHIELTIENNQSKVLEVCLPKWRPGRYELGNFARNIYQFSTRDALTGKELSCQKQSSHQWFIQTEGASTIRIIYSYYAAELNAGSTFLDNSQLYINPVNCCL